MSEEIRDFAGFSFLLGLFLYAYDNLISKFLGTIFLFLSFYILLDEIGNIGDGKNDKQI
ncbi:MAG: hypothetical protein ACP5LA_07405 [Thermoplasmata archaeon]